MGAGMAPFAGMTRAVALYVLAGYTPLIGWFVVAPAALLISVGSFAATIRPRRTDAARPVVAEPGLPGLGQMP
jgi:hypothetical protein